MSRQQQRSYGAGSVYQRKTDGRWVAKLCIDGKTATRYAGTQGGAKNLLATLQKELGQNGTLASPGKRTVNDLLDLWLETSGPNLRPRTIADYDARLNRHIRPALGRTKLSKLTPERIQLFYSSILKRGTSREAAYSHALLHRALRLAVLWGWLPQNPTDRVQRPKHQAERKDVWTISELRRLLEGTEGNWLHPFWTLAATTGCRLSELAGFKWQDIDLAVGTITVRRSLHRIGGQWIESSPKTQSGTRVIVLPPSAVVALRRQRTQQAKRRLKVGTNCQDTEHVFTGELGQPIHQSTIQKALHRECERLGLPSSSPHQLRHLHASLLLAEGLPLPAVSSRLGHGSPGITMTIYAHAMQHQDQQAAAVMEAVLGG